MSSNSNLGYTGYLLRKTIQPFSLKYDTSNFNDYREKNMILYINKKVGNTRKREGNTLSTQSLQKGINLVVRKGNGRSSNKEGDDQQNGQDEKEVNIQQLKQEEKREMKDPLYREIIQIMNQDEYYDDFAVVSEENKVIKTNQSKKERSDIGETLKMLVSNNIEPEKVRELFRDYKKVSLKDKLDELKSRKVDMAKIQRKIKKDQQKMKELEDIGKVNNFMGQVCSAKNITIGKILQINQDDIEYKQQSETTQEGVPRAKALEMLEELMEDQEEDNQKNLIKIFKQSQLDGVDADAARNKFNMTSFKKKNEQTQKLYQKMAKNSKQAIINALKNPIQDPEKFTRKRDSVKPPSQKINVFRRLVQPENWKDSKIKVKLNQKEITATHLQTSQDICHENIKNTFFKSDSHHQLAKSVQSFSQNKSKSVYLNFASPLKIKSPQLANTATISTNLGNSPVHNESTYSQFNQAFYNLSCESSPKIYFLNKNSFPLSIQQQSGLQENVKNKHCNFESEHQRSKTLQLSQSLSSQLYKKQHSVTDSTTLSDFVKGQDEILNINNEAALIQRKILKLQGTKQSSQGRELQNTLNQMVCSQQVHHFVKTCNEQKLSDQKYIENVSSIINELENVMQEQLKEINQMQQGEIDVVSKVENPNFIDFIQGAEFKRKLITYLVKKVDRKSDVYSKFMSKQFTQNFLQKLSEKECPTGVPE